ncbi:MAG TPA: T9SS type A sorting domain-containing protein [Bacteroidales bacterium]|jgi:hypothetical protein|nr:T9SS type A sorting domain-containing protein [Bacteroidales bacterium]
MNNVSKFLILAVLVFSIATPLSAKKFKGEVRPSPNMQNIKAAACLPATNSNELTINNVRAYLETNGTMWFKEIARYEIPKGSGKTSMFAAALWIGGLDVNKQLKLAAVRFRQVGDDFWTGPLTLTGASVDQVTCKEYDKHFKITRAEVEAHRGAWNSETNSFAPGYVIPNSIKNWPAHGDVEKGQSFYLAPFFDIDNDGVYKPEKGDYPYYDLDNALCPWTEQNIELAQQDALPKTPEELSGTTKGMIYADHVLKGDETLYWIFNDKGGQHTESQGDPIGLEIRGQAFGFATNDEINNMTFYSYEIINRSTFELTQTFFSQWVDPDLGYEGDDYVGCDVTRGLGYCYNGYDIDGQGLAQHYGNHPPAVGVDFFQGPYMDDDGIDNPKFYPDSVRLDPTYCDKFLNNPAEAGLEWDDKKFPMAINGVNFGDGIVDNERFGMRRFVYHNNDHSVVGDPSVAYEYYYMLRGYWKDGTKMKYGANAHTSNGATGPECDFMFPGLTDLCNWGTQGIDPDPTSYGDGGWTEANVGNAPADRRFMQSAGPFTLKAGAVNYITVGIPWARASSGGAWESVKLLKIADDKCQALFENCFKVLDGPDAPDITIRELDKKLILYISNDDPISNNYQESYAELDNQIPRTQTITTTTITLDSIVTNINGVDTVIYYQNYNAVENVIEYTQDERSYKFEGYLIYQLRNENVSITDLSDPNLAQLIGQCDVENYRSNGTAIGQLINWEYSDALATSVPVEKVAGSNEGIYHSKVITEDRFATGSTTLVNHKKYYFMVLAYAYNEYAPFSIDPNIDNGLLGQKKVFLAGRKAAGGGSIKPVVGIPHDVTPQFGGTVLNAEYGTQPVITRIEGQGNGGFFCEISQKTKEQIMAGYPWKVDEIEYEKDAGPIGVKVIDPLKLQARDYIIKFVEPAANDVTENTSWILEYTNENGEIDTLSSQSTISLLNEQLILSHGIAITILNKPFEILQKEVAENSIFGTKTYQNLAKFAQVQLIGSSITYADKTKQWLGGAYDFTNGYIGNWIRSGNQSAGAWDFAEGVQDGVENKYHQWKTEDYFLIVPEGTLNQSWRSRAWKDPKEQFENVVNGTWAPYVLATTYDGGPQQKYVYPDYPGNMTEPLDPYWGSKIKSGSVYADFTTSNFNQYHYNQSMINLYSVDIVLTPDKSKWTRCVVLEACEDRTKSIGNAWRFEPRKSPSVDKEGRPDGSGTGMGWFPGYAINIETGERLNIMFSENSADTANNGDDMLFNPTSVYGYDEEGNPLSEGYYNALYKYYQETVGEFPNNFPNPSFGGKHFIYIVGSSGNTGTNFYQGASATRSYNANMDCGSYDEGAWLKNKFSNFVDISTHNDSRKQKKNELFNNVMWTSIPMAIDKKEDLWLSNDVTIKIRVTRPYLRWSSYKGAEPQTVQNDNFPMYRFSTRTVAVQHNVLDVAVSALDNINIIPNPYYGFSAYESSALDNQIKIVNLPQTCTISIYTVNGILVRRLSKGDSGSTYVNWDLKNSAGIPIASGMYIVHVQVPGVGEKTLKFFAAMRPTDLNAF